MDPVREHVRRLADWRALAVALLVVSAAYLCVLVRTVRTAEAVYRVPGALEMVEAPR
jgi:hypothetical protein